jgi:hypothetical protein
MRGLCLGLLALVAAALGGCNQTIDKLAETASGKDCSFARWDRVNDFCVDRKRDQVAERTPYCYKTIGAVNCYATPNPFEDPDAPFHPLGNAVNTLPWGTRPPGDRPIAINASLREAAAAKAMDQQAAINAQVERERLAALPPPAPREPTKIEPLPPPAPEMPAAGPAKKAPVKKKVVQKAPTKPRTITAKPPAATTDEPKKE